MKLTSVLVFGCLAAFGLAAKVDNELHLTLVNVASELTNEDLDVIESTMNQLVSAGGCIRREIQQIRQNLRSLAAGKTPTAELVIRAYFTDCESGSRRQLKGTSSSQAVGAMPRTGRVTRKVDDGQPLVEVARRFGAEIVETRYGERLLLIPSGLCGNFPPPGLADDKLIEGTTMVVTAEDLSVDDYMKVAEKWLVALQSSRVKAFAELSSLVVTD